MLTLLQNFTYWGKTFSFTLPNLIISRELVVRAIENRFAVDESGLIIEFGEGGCPWKEHFFDLEKKMELDEPGKQILYAIFKDEKGSYRIQGVPRASQSFELRLALPEEWRGVRDRELDQITGIDGCIFVHAAGKLLK